MRYMHCFIGHKYRADIIILSRWVAFTKVKCCVKYEGIDYLYSWLPKKYTLLLLSTNNYVRILKIKIKLSHRQLI